MAKELRHAFEEDLTTGNGRYPDSNSGAIPTKGRNFREEREMTKNDTASKAAESILSFLSGLISLIFTVVGIVWLCQGRVSDGLLAFIVGELIDINRKTKTT